jgi:hypothetical protein
MRGRIALLPLIMVGMLIVIGIGLLTARESTAQPLGQHRGGYDKVPPPVETIPIPTPVGTSWIPEPCEGMSFTDVAASDWFHDGVEYLYCERAISGYSTNPPCESGTPCYRPSTGMTRGQAAKVIANLFLAGRPVMGGFTDVLPGSAFYDGVGKLKSAGVAAGYPDNTFRPNEPVSRGQFLKMISGAIHVVWPNLWPLVSPAERTFEDVQQDNPFYVYIEAAVAHGALYGYPCGGAGEPCGVGNKPYFRFGSPVNRAQASMIAYRLESWTPPH